MPNYPNEFDSFDEPEEIENGEIEAERQQAWFELQQDLYFDRLENELGNYY